MQGSWTWPIPQAVQYHSDALAVYQALVCAPGQHTAHLGKSETYAVEGDNAELRHYLARIARRSRCFSQCIEALRCAVQLFVWCWKQRQLKKQAYPQYAVRVLEFVPPLSWTLRTPAKFNSGWRRIFIVISPAGRGRNWVKRTY